MSLVLDCSVALAWVLPDENQPVADQLLTKLQQQSACVPQLWPLEVGNVLLVAQRRGRMTEAEAGLAITSLRALPLDIDPYTHENALGETIHLARLYGLSLYDATYLELALRKELPLATLDRRLREAAQAATIELAI